jgi:hypothetical protein
LGFGYGYTPGYFVTINSTALAVNYTGGASNPDNKATLDALALQIATDYYARIQVQDSVVMGVSQWQETGLEDWVEFFVGRPDGVDQVLCTRIHSVPYDQQLNNMLHFDNTTWEYGTFIYGTLQGDLAAGGTATIRVTGGDSVIPQASDGRGLVTVTNVHNITGTTGQVVGCIRSGNKWIVISKDCP